jgi:uncharacterized membrane protein YcaP (DUF421 family)
MNDMLTEYLGSGAHLSISQMMLRGVVVFAFTLLMIRISGRRSLGQHSPFDACITVLLGAILSRAVVGASPFAATMATGAILVLVHRAVAMLSSRLAWFGSLIDGSPRTLVLEGKVDAATLRKALISRADLMQALREHSVPEDLSAVRQIVLECNGDISVMKHDYAS